MILIPAYNPPQSFADLVFALLEKARDLDIPIIVVDDGSTNPESVAVINTVEKQPEVTVLRHRSNLGKGSALKLGIQYAKETGVEYVVSADADGQHLPSDIIRLAQLSKSCDDFIIGTRRFDDGVPARSLIGNTITKFVFFVATGQSLSDTQSGLRCIPRKLFNDFLQIPANKYDFELHCLLRAAELKTISTENIQTVYEDGNPTSHFRPLIDSMLIYAVFFRYSLAAISIAAFDIAFFIFLSAIFPRRVHSFSGDALCIRSDLFCYYERCRLQRACDHCECHFKISSTRRIECSVWILRAPACGPGDFT